MHMHTHMHTHIHVSQYVHSPFLNRRDQQKWLPRDKGTKRWDERKTVHFEYPFVPFEF